MKPWNKGKSGFIVSEETRKKMSLNALGRKHSKESIDKMSEVKKGHKVSKEARIKISESLKGRESGRKGIPMSLEARIKMSESHKGKTGKDSSNWRGGLSVKPYSVDWTNTLRISIRERDHYTCQICKEKQGDKAFSVHHIDYDKLNCNSDNLITLCKSCHMKTNGKRDEWERYFKNYLCYYPQADGDSGDDLEQPTERA